MKASLGLVQTVLKSAGVPMLVIDRRTGAILEANAEAVRLYGWKKPELLHKKERELRAASSTPRAKERLHASRDGRTFSVTIRPLTLPGQSLQLLTAPHSVTKEETCDCEAVEEALNVSERRFRAIFDCSFQLVSLLETDGTLLEINQAALDFGGVTREEVVGKPFWETPFWDEKNGAREKMKNAVGRAARGEFIRYTIEARGAGGQAALMDFSLKPMFDESGRVTLLIPEGRDITSTKLQEEERLRASKLESLGVLAGGIAHDLNNIMMCISLSLELIRLQAHNGKVTDDRIDEALENVKRASDLSKRLLTFARGGDPVMTSLRPGELVSSALNLSLRGSNLQPHVEIAPVLPRVLGDESQLTQVLDHLVINAREATPQGGQLWIRVLPITVQSGESPFLKGGPYVKIEVQDEGCGIPQENIGRIFDPYFTTKPTGTGIGLTTCFSIVRRHGGSIVVRSKEGQGSLFTVLLPGTVESSKEEVLTSQVKEVPHAGGRILIVEDDVTLRDSLSHILGLSGYAVVTTGTGEAAFSLFRKAQRAREPFDIVLIDATIKGGIGGAEALDLLRRADPNIVAILMSGYTSSTAMTEWQQMGFRGVLRKPFTSSDAIEIIKKVRNGAV